MSKLNCQIFISGNGSNLKNIIQKVDSGFLQNIHIHTVITDNPGAEGLRYAHERDISTKIISDVYGYEDISLDIKKYNIDLIVLAGFMKILPKYFVEHHDGKIINLHPSLLPKHRGLDTHKRVIQSGDSLHGASVHFVTEKLDEGPVFIQGVIEVKESDTVSTLKKSVHNIEYQILPIAMRWFSEQLIEKNGKYFNFRGVLEKEPIRYL